MERQLEISRAPLPFAPPTALVVPTPEAAYIATYYQEKMERPLNPEADCVPLTSEEMEEVSAVLSALLV